MTMTTLSQTLAQIDRDAAALRQRAIDEQRRHDAEMTSIAAATALQAERDAAEQRRQAAQAEFENGALAAARNSFANFHERANNLCAMARQCEEMQAAIVAGAMEMERDAAATVKMLVDALPEPTEDAASDALAAAGLDGLRYSLPDWLKALNQKRWLSWPGVNSEHIYMLARGLASDRAKQKR